MKTKSKMYTKSMVALMAALWLLKRKHALFLCIIFANTAFTLALLVHTSALVMPRLAALAIVAAVRWPRRSMTIAVAGTSRASSQAAIDPASS